MIHERYPSTGLERVLKRFLDDVRLSEALTDVLIPAYDVVQRCPFHFDSAKARRDPTEDYPMRVAARVPHRPILSLTSTPLAIGCSSTAASTPTTRRCARSPQPNRAA